MYSKEWLRPDEIESMISLPTLTEKYEIWILLLYVPALRVTEAINIRDRDLDLEGESIDVWKGKGRDGYMQKVPCDIATLKRIKRYSQHNNLRSNDYIMFSNKSSKVHRSHGYKVVNNILQQVNLDKTIGTHTFRRSRAQHLLDSGLPLVYVSKLLLHKNLSTTMHYLNVSVVDIQREMEKISDPMDKISAVI
ncbi:tyrosine-type recombinase/integrase [uncultured Methanolobus sp.]|uniref:tyrosine-type recombinase/integrase n=1 Tax=uncultured Methanolobus sp. TaxID=218300 RepID=UPI002AABDBD3|nr:tyrosine-type recombinase/integrase [uncultured Methanolobus sp.]